MMTRTDIVLATHNQGKVREVKKFFANSSYNILSLADISVDIDVVEDGDTFAANAAKKARQICDATGKMVLADDSGLVIDALDGAPGVDSANYMGRETPYPVRNAKILEMMASMSEEARGARFVCVIAIARPGHGDIMLADGTIEGRIAHEIAGADGFGYDPIFFVPEFGKTMAQMSIDDKNQISHRGMALQNVLEMLEKL